MSETSLRTTLGSGFRAPISVNYRAGGESWMAGSLKKGLCVMVPTWAGNNMPSSRADPGKGRKVYPGPSFLLLVAFFVGTLGGQSPPVAMAT